MPRSFIYIAGLCQLFCLFAKAQSAGGFNTLLLQGYYQEQNIYIQNPLRYSDTGFCTQHVKVNGKEVGFEKASAYVIELDSLGLKLDDSITIKIVHYNDCKPKILAPNGHRRTSFCLDTISLSSDGLLQWTASKETGSTFYTVEQFRWNKWLEVGEVEGPGKTGTNSYTFLLSPHSGLNKVRVKKLTSSMRYELSRNVECVSLISPVTFTIDNINKQIVFSAETMYELYDIKGNILKRETGKTINCSSIKAGKYFLNYDNRSVDLKLKWK
jgi:hypothetical protein